MCYIGCVKSMFCWWLTIPVRTDQVIVRRKRRKEKKSMSERINCTYTTSRNAFLEELLHSVAYLSGAHHPRVTQLPIEKIMKSSEYLYWLWQVRKEWIDNIFCANVTCVTYSPICVQLYICLSATKYNMCK